MEQSSSSPSSIYGLLVRRTRCLSNSERHRRKRRRSLWTFTDNALWRTSLRADSALQRNIPMLLRRILIPLSLQHSQRLDQLLTRLARLDNCIHKSAISRHVGIRQPLAKFFNLFLANRFAIFSALQFAVVDDIPRAFRPHHRNFGARPGIVHVRADVL